MTKKRIGLVAAIVVLLAVGGALGGLLSDRGSGSPAQVPQPEVAADQSLNGFSLGDTQGLVESVQSFLRTDPTSVKALDTLGIAYQQRARETGDPTYYTKSQGILDKALRLDPNDLFATSGLGSLALSRHEFRNALELGEKARALSPTTARNYGIVGDALLELGRYRQAFDMFDRMSQIKPSISAYARVSYARELLGDVDGSIASMRLALDAARGAPEPRAWTQTQLGKIYWTVGKLDEAESFYRQALRSYPDYVYALDALAQIEGARGRYAKAIQLEQQAVAVIPLPQFVTQLGDLYEVSGQPKLAQEQYDLMDAIRRLFIANGVKTDLETGVYYADHGFRLPQALDLARIGRSDRPSIDGDDGLAWALERNGQCQEALGYSKLALRLGTQDAPKFFHRGMIERCLGHEQEARQWFQKALDLNPHFSLLWAPVAAEYAR